MKAISMALGEWQVLSDKNMKVNPKLPAKTFSIMFGDMRGYYLKEEPNLVVKEKLYGPHTQNVETIIEGYQKSDRSIGAIFSGAKGLGKSISMRYLTSRMIELGYPIILVNKYMPDLSEFIKGIEQDCVLVFDEFDKIFNDERTEESQDSRAATPLHYGKKFKTKQTKQEELLGLFDGLNSNKFLFIITCNKVDELSQYLLNRPGRFHYHVRFGYPEVDEARVYLEDNIKKEYWDQIEDVLTYVKKVDVNYDGLRSICFEINLGRKFNDIIKLMNIGMENGLVFEVKLKLNGYPEMKESIKIYNNDTVIEYWFYCHSKGLEIKLGWDLSKARFDSKKNLWYLNPEDVDIIDCEVDREAVKEKDLPPIDYFTFERNKNSNTGWV